MRIKVLVLYSVFLRTLLRMHFCACFFTCMLVHVHLSECVCACLLICINVLGLCESFCARFSMRIRVLEL
ncbi:hypothetical protein MIMGU_mgv1a020744mg [Erythranthe guttata]|uniref:Uncharacterized protein n=1 Tax=Erythranthe guttata TaxID=4155 RepID=A0A022QPI2_ERYGU|nr:hypothetical protein MIMGU_mgv1a020744mg [Erythranthe guttata]